MSPLCQPGRPVEILLVEDNPFDVHLAEVALKETKAAYRLQVVEDGEKALAYLYRRGDFEGATRPDVILLDLNLPRKSGLEVLADVKTNPELRNIPVIVLTTSKAEEDVIRSYNLYVNCFVTKPMDVSEFLKVMRCITDFWLGVAVLPKTAA